MKKISILILGLILIVGLLSACTKPASAAAPASAVGSGVAAPAASSSMVVPGNCSRTDFDEHICLLSLPENSDLQGKVTGTFCSGLNDEHQNYKAREWKWWYFNASRFVAVNSLCDSTSNLQLYSDSSHYWNCKDWGFFGGGPGCKLEEKKK